jgi:outer membrane protein TolC
LEKRVQIQDENYQYSSRFEKHNIEKQVADQYLNTLRLSKLAGLSRDAVSNLEEQRKLISGMVEKGYSTLRDYLLIKIESENQSISLEDILQQYQSSLFQLYVLCGIQDTTVVQIDSVSLNPTPIINRSDFMKKFEIDSLFAASEQTLFETKYHSQVNVFLNTGLGAVELDRIERKFGMSAGVNLSLSLFDGNQKHITRQQNLLALQTIRESKRFYETTVAHQRKSAESRIQSLQKNIERLSKSIDDYQKLLDMTSNQLRQGGVSMIEYLTLLKNDIEIKKNKIDLEINLLLEINNYNYWNW